LGSIIVSKWRCAFFGWWSLGFVSKFIWSSAYLCIISEISLLYLWKFVLSVISIIVFVFVWIVCVYQIVLIISVFKDKWLSHLCWSMNMIILVVEWRKFETILPSLASEATFVWWLYLSIISVVIKVFIWIICVNQIVIIISVLKN